jgi:hypothetical protein
MIDQAHHKYWKLFLVSRQSSLLGLNNGLSHGHTYLH